MTSSRVLLLVIPALLAGACGLPELKRPDAVGGDAGPDGGADLVGVDSDAGAADGAPDGPTGLLVGERRVTVQRDRDLTVEGTLDWVHFGRGDVGSLNRKDQVEPQIGDVSLLGTGSLQLLDCCTDSFSWTDGTPTVMETGTIGGLLIDSPSPSGDGFELRVRADTQERLLRVYAGLFCVQTRLEASLSDGSAPPVPINAERTSTEAEASQYTFRYRAASPGAELVIRLEITQNYCLTGDLGEVWLEAATLASDRP